MDKPATKRRLLAPWMRSAPGALLRLAAMAAMAVMAVMLGGCSLAPAYRRPAALISPVYPVYPSVDAGSAPGTGTGSNMAAATNGAGIGTTAAGALRAAHGETGTIGARNQVLAREAADTGWRDYFPIPRLQAMIATALLYNQDLRTAVLRIEEARAQYQVVAADRLPNVTAGASASRARAAVATGAEGTQTVTGQRYEAGLSMPAFELDFFGRVRSLSAAALESYLATEEARLAAQISLVAEVAQAYFAERAYAEQYALARQTVQGRQQTLALTRQRVTAGASSLLDLRQDETLYESARVAAADLARQRAQAENALTLLVGHPPLSPAQPVVPASAAGSAPAAPAADSAPTGAAIPAAPASASAATPACAPAASASTSATFRASPSTSAATSASTSALRAAKTSDCGITGPAAAGATVPAPASADAAVIKAQASTSALPDDEALDAMSALPEDLPSALISRRPDIRAAEQRLKAANANIGAARAAFFPSISLTAAIGVTSAEFSSLFKSGSRTWSFAPQLLQPIFDAGRNKGNLSLAEARANLAVADYEKTIQVAFREVADALAARSYVADQVAAQRAVQAAQADRLRLLRLRQQGGISSTLEVLDAQRELFSAQQSLVLARLLRTTSAIDLYRALGGGVK